MKKTSFLAAAFFLSLLIGCSSKTLSRENALELIKKQYPYPAVQVYSIFTADPAFSQKIIDAGLANEGLINVDKTPSFKIHPIITFTDKAKPFLLPVEEKDKADHIARVRAAEEDIIAVTGIKMLGQGKKAIVEYTTQYKDLTPFAAIDKDQLVGGKTNSKKAYFSLFDDGWRLEKKPGLDFMTE